MTEQDYRELPDREKGALVVEHVMGWEFHRSPQEQIAPSWWVDETGKTAWKGLVFSPSTDIEAAWQVVDKIRIPGQCFVSMRTVLIKQTDTLEWLCAIEYAPPDYNVFLGTSESAPDAICLAALKAVGVVGGVTSMNTGVNEICSN